MTMSAMMNSYQQYKKHNVMMANPMQLVIMLYDGAIKKLRQAEMAIGSKDIEAANEHLQSAQDIVMELMMGLDLSYGIAQDLLKIYEFVNHEIASINASKQVEGIEPVVAIMLSLRDAWEKVHNEYKGGLYAAGQEGE
jgi:flagellar protein FliS